MSLPLTVKQEADHLVVNGMKLHHAFFDVIASGLLHKPFAVYARKDGVAMLEHFDFAARLEGALEKLLQDGQGLTMGQTLILRAAFR